MKFEVKIMYEDFLFYIICDIFEGKILRYFDTDINYRPVIIWFRDRWSKKLMSVPLYCALRQKVPRERDRS